MTPVAVVTGAGSGIGCPSSLAFARRGAAVLVSDVNEPSADYERSDWDALLALNLPGVWLCLKHQIPVMVEQRAGPIVNTASTFGIVGVRGMCAYVASEHGVVGLTKAAALEYATAGVSVNAVCPGLHPDAAAGGVLRVPQRGRSRSGGRRVHRAEPIGRLGRPEEIAEALVWLGSDAASFVTGHSLAIDGGWVAQ